jgi:hypothetical protein
MDPKMEARPRKIKEIDNTREKPRLSKAATEGEKRMVIIKDKRVGVEREGVIMKMAMVPAMAPIRQASLRRSVRK